MRFERRHIFVCRWSVSSSLACKSKCESEHISRPGCHKFPLSTIQTASVVDEKVTLTATVPRVLSDLIRFHQQLTTSNNSGPPGHGESWRYSGQRSLNCSEITDIDSPCRFSVWRRASAC